MLPRTVLSSLRLHFGLHLQGYLGDYRQSPPHLPQFQTQTKSPFCVLPFKYRS
jgi:hypothetical protein